MASIKSTEMVPIIIVTNNEVVEDAIEFAAGLINEIDQIDSEYARGQIELIMAFGTWAIYVDRGVGKKDLYLRTAEPDEARAAIRGAILNVINLKKGA